MEADHTKVDAADSRLLCVFVFNHDYNLCWDDGMMAWMMISGLLFFAFSKDTHDVHKFSSINIDRR